MYLLNSTPISPDAQFESNGILYPAGWIRSATDAERTAAGIVWHDDQPRPDDFYQYVYPDPAYPWQWLSTPYTDEQMKTKLEAYSRTKREQRVLAGVEHTIGPDTFFIPTDIDTRGAFFNYRVITERPGAPVVTPYDFGTKVVALSEPQLLAIEQKMEIRVHGCLTTQINLQAKIKAGTVTTKEEIDAAYEAVP